MFGYMVQVGPPVIASMATSWTREGLFAIPAMDWLVDIQLQLWRKQLAADLKQHDSQVDRDKLKLITVWLELVLNTQTVQKNAID